MNKLLLTLLMFFSSFCSADEMSRSDARDLMELTSGMIELGFDYYKCLDRDTVFFSISNSMDDKATSFLSLRYSLRELNRRSYKKGDLIHPTVCRASTSEAWKESSTPVNIEKLSKATLEAGTPIGEFTPTQFIQLKYLMMGTMIIGFGGYHCEDERKAANEYTSSSSPVPETFDDFFNTLGLLINECDRKSDLKWNVGAEL